MSLTVMSLGQKLKKIRRFRGMTVSDLAREIGASVNSIHVYETGTSPLSVPTLIKILKVLDVELEFKNVGDKIDRTALLPSSKPRKVTQRIEDSANLDVLLVPNAEVLRIMQIMEAVIDVTDDSMHVT